MMIVTAVPPISHSVLIKILLIQKSKVYRNHIKKKYFYTNLSVQEIESDIIQIVSTVQILAKMNAVQNPNTG